MQIPTRAIVFVLFKTAVNWRDAWYDQTKFTFREILSVLYDYIFCQKLNPQQVESRYTSNNKMIMLWLGRDTKQLITWPKRREEETGNPAATLSQVKISTSLESNQPTSFLFCFKNCFSVLAEGLKRPTWYYRMCSLSPYGVAVGFFYDTTSRITVVVEASKPRHSNESAIFRFLLLLLFCFLLA